MFIDIIFEHFSTQKETLVNFLRISKAKFLWAVLLSASSEFLQVLALFMPLKVIIVLGDKKKLSDLQADTLHYTDLNIVLLGVFIVLMVYLAAVVLGVYSNRLFSGALLDINQKHPLEDNKKIKDYKSQYKLNFNSYSNLIIIVLGLLVSLVIKPFFFIGVILCLFLEILLINSIFNYREGFFSKIARSIKANSLDYLTYFAAINFLLIFIFLIFEYLITYEFKTTTSILILLLYRRVFQSMKRYISIAIKIHDKIMIKL